MTLHNEKGPATNGAQSQTYCHHSNLKHNVFQDVPQAENTDSIKQDFETLKARAEKLRKDSSPEEINTIIQDCAGIGVIARRRVLEIIKKKTDIPLGNLEKAQIEFSGGVEPNHLSSAHSVLSKLGYENILATVTHVWAWDRRGIWRAIPDRELKQLVQSALEEQGEAVMRALVDGVTDVLKSEIFRTEHEWNRSQDTINVVNGELHRNKSAWELRPHDREHFLTTQIPVIYNPEATCPRFSQFLQEIFRGDPDATAKAQALLEMIGYTLACHARYERFALLIGAGANGKSVVLEVIRLLVGRDNVAAVQPSQMGNKFQRAHLHLKLANLVTEIAEGSEIADAELKAIVSGELTTVEHKHQTPFDFSPYATCWFGANHMPHTRDFSDALFRRALVIPFNQTFKAGGNADPHLKNKLEMELSGILNLALKAYGDVIQRGSFTDPDSCLRAKEEWRIEADQVAQFLGDRCEMVADARTSSAELYLAYKLWTEDAGITRRLNRKNFTNRVQRRGGQLCKGSGGKRMIAGVRLKSMVEEDDF